MSVAVFFSKCASINKHVSNFLITWVKVVFAAEVGGDFLRAEDCLTALGPARCLRPLFSSGPSIDSGVAFPCLFDTSVLCFLSVRHPTPPPRVCACLSVCVCVSDAAVFAGRAGDKVACCSFHDSVFLSDGSLRGFNVGGVHEPR